MALAVGRVRLLLVATIAATIATIITTIVAVAVSTVAVATVAAIAVATIAASAGAIAATVGAVAVAAIVATIATVASTVASIVGSLSLEAAIAFDVQFAKIGVTLLHVGSDIGVSVVWHVSAKIRVLLDFLSMVELVNTAESLSSKDTSKNIACSS